MLTSYPITHVELHISDINNYDATLPIFKIINATFKDTKILNNDHVIKYTRPNNTVASKILINIDDVYEYLIDANLALTKIIINNCFAKTDLNKIINYFNPKLICNMKND